MLQEEKGMVEKTGMHEPAWPAGGATTKRLSEIWAGRLPDSWTGDISYAERPGM